MRTVVLALCALAATEDSALTPKTHYETKWSGFHDGTGDGFLQMYFKSVPVHGARLLSREQVSSQWNPLVDTKSPLLSAGYSRWTNEGDALVFAKADGSASTRCRMAKAGKAGDAVELSMKCSAIAEPRFAERRGDDYKAYDMPFWHQGVPAWAPASWSNYHGWAMNGQGYWACPTKLSGNKCSQPVMYPLHAGMPTDPAIYNHPVYGHPALPNPAHYTHINMEGLRHGAPSADSEDDAAADDSADDKDDKP